MLLQSSVRMKLICRQIVAELTGLGLSMDKLLQLTTSARINLSEQDVQALVATLSLIFASAAKHAVDPSALLAELEQLGLPKGPSDTAAIVTVTMKVAMTVTRKLTRLSV